MSGASSVTSPSVHWYLRISVATFRSSGSPLPRIPRKWSLRGIWGRGAGGGLMKMFSVSDLSYPLFIPKGSKAISPGSRRAIRGRS